MTRPLPGALRGYPGAALALASDGRIVDSNGRLEEELGVAIVGRPFAELLDADSSLGKWERLLGAAGAGPPSVWELTLAGGATIPEPRAFSVLRDDDARTVWLLEHPRDVRLDDLRERATEVNSELVNTQRDLQRERSRLARALDALEMQKAELERSNRALDEFAHVVSHDLKAPLRALANTATWIGEDLGDEAEVRGHLETMRAQVARLQAMIAGILGYARAGRREEAVQRVDTGALVREIVELLDVPAGSRVEIASEMPVLDAAAAPLRQVFQNLVDNALKHARRADACVRVQARPRGERWEFTVADNGPGIPEGARERIWKLFQTLEPSDGVARTGIGLALVRRLVESEGGRVWVESRPGEGAEFHFEWPVSPAARAREGA